MPFTPFNAQSNNSSNINQGTLPTPGFTPYNANPVPQTQKEVLRTTIDNSPLKQSFNDIGNAVGGFIGDVKQRVSNIGGILEKGANSGKILSPGEVLTTGTNVAKEATGIIPDVFNRGIKALSDIIGEDPGLQKIAMSKVGDATLGTAQAGSDIISTLSEPVKQRLSAWAQEHPQVSSLISSLGQTALNVAPLVGAPKAAGLATKTGDTLAGLADTGLAKSEQILSGVSNKVSDITSTAKNAITPLKKNELQTIADNIAPPMSAKEIKLAESQGRIVTGREPSLLKGGTPDQVLHSDNVTNAAFVINKEIPGAAKLSQPDLYTALEGRTSDMAKQLEPTMRATRVQPNTLKSHLEDWIKLKEKQIVNSDLTEEPNVRKIQGQFDTRIKNLLNGEATLDDVWKERISYDNSVPTNVKNANQLSDSRLQMKKELWLQNRSVLNDIINDSESGLGKNSIKAFKDMKAMYDAKANLLSKAKSNFEATAQPSKIAQWIKNNPWKAGIVGSAVLGGTGLPKKVLDIVTGGAL